MAIYTLSQLEILVERAHKIMSSLKISHYSLPAVVETQINKFVSDLQVNDVIKQGRAARADLLQAADKQIAEHGYTINAMGSGGANAHSSNGPQTTMTGSGGGAFNGSSPPDVDKARDEVFDKAAAVAYKYGCKVMVIVYDDNQAFRFRAMSTLLVTTAIGYLYRTIFDIERANREGKAPVEAPVEQPKPKYKYEVDAHGEFIRPRELRHLCGTREPELWKMQRVGGETARLATAELEYRDAVISAMGQG